MRNLENIYKSCVQQTPTSFEYNPWVRALAESARARTLHHQTSCAFVQLADGRRIGSGGLHVLEQWMLIRLHAFFKEVWPGDQSAEWKKHLQLSDEHVLTELNRYADALAEGVITPLLKTLCQPAIVKGVLDGLAEVPDQKLVESVTHPNDWPSGLKKTVQTKEGTYDVASVCSNAKVYCAELGGVLSATDPGLSPDAVYRQQLDALKPKDLDDLKIGMLWYLLLSFLQFLGCEARANDEVKQAQSNFHELAKRDFNDLMKASPVRSKFNKTELEGCFSKRYLSDYHSFQQQFERYQKDCKTTAQRSAHGKTQRASAIGFFAQSHLGATDQSRAMYAKGRATCRMYVEPPKSCAQEAARMGANGVSVASGPGGMVSC